MDAKLTLKLDKEVIDKAKDYASSQHRSLSRIIESYLRSLIFKNNSEAKDGIEICPFVKSMATGVNVPADFDDKQEYSRHIEQKYR